MEQPLARKLVAEYLGSALLAALVIGSGIAAQRLSPSDTGLELTENAAATAAGLFAIILMFGSIRGVHFNPVVSFVDAALGGLPWRPALAYLPAQLAGCVSGAVLANLMFSASAVSISTKDRATAAHGLSEVVATIGLVVVIFALVRSGRADRAPAAVGAYIGAAYWFTSSTSFANPAITIGRGEPNRREDLRGELAQVAVGTIQGGQVPVVAEQPRRGLLPGGAQVRPADPLPPDQPADPFVVDPQVEDDVQEIVEQGLAVLAGLAALGQLVAHLALGLAFPRGHGLVEQVHYLVEHIGRRLRQQSEQDRVPALRIAVLQGLRRQPASGGGEEPATLGRQHRQVQDVRAQSAQELQLRDLLLDRDGGRLDRAGGQPTVTATRPMPRTARR